MPTSKHRCSDCGKSFERKWTWKRHVQLKHQPEFEARAHICFDCGKELSRKDLLDRHRKIHTGGGVPCARCGRSFRGDFLPRHELACRKRFHPGSSITSTAQPHLLRTLSQTERGPIETASPSSPQVAKKPPRPISFVRVALNPATAIIEDLDLSQEEILFQAIRTAIAHGDLRRLRDLVSASPPPCDTIQGLAQRYRQFAKRRGIRKKEVLSDPFTRDIRTCAARHGQLDIIKALTESELALHDSYPHGITPLHWAARYGHDSTIRYFLQHYRMEIDVEEEGYTALDYAIMANRKSAVKLLVANLPQEFLWSSSHPLYTAIRSGNLGMVRLLFELDMGVLQGNAAWSPPLDWAAERGDTQIINFLLDSGASVDGEEKRTQRTPLCSAASFGKLPAARVLIQRGASVNGVGGNFGTTPLMCACYFEEEDDIWPAKFMIDLLISKGADVDICRPDSPSAKVARTALTEACSGYAIIEIIEQFLLHGADPNLGSPTPLEIALSGGHGAATVRLLLKAGAKVNLVSRRCMENLRGIVDGSLDKGRIGRPWGSYYEPTRKLQLLHQYISHGSDEVIEISSGEDTLSDDEMSTDSEC